MIAEWDTNCLFVSDRLEKDDPLLFASLRSALHGNAIEFITETSDIWCRDYMPVQLSENSFCQFTYRPDYLKGFVHLITPPARCRLPFMEKYHVEPIVLDGANDDTKQLLADIDQVVCVLRLQLADHSHCQEAIAKLQAALLEGRQVAGTYSSPHEASPVELLLNPIRLCLIKNAWYLVAQAVGGEPKTYRVARFGKVEVLDAAAVVPSNFDVRAYFGNAWAVFRGARTFDIQVRFLPDAARIVTETQWHATQQATPAPDGSVVLSFRIDGLEEICNWLLGWAGRAEVLEPLELRQMVASKLREGLELNH